MSPSNVELLIQGFTGWGKDNPANMRHILHPDCELIVPDSVPYGGTLQRIDAVTGWFTRELWRWFDEFTSTPEGLIDAGDQIVVPVHVQARAKNGKTLDVHTSGSTSSARGSWSAAGSTPTRRSCATRSKA